MDLKLLPELEESLPLEPWWRETESEEFREAELPEEDAEESQGVTVTVVAAQKVDTPAQTPPAAQRPLVLAARSLT